MVRQYTPEQRASALAALAACGGSLSEAARRTGIPRNTLRGWAEGTFAPPPPAAVSTAKKDLSDMLEGIAYALAEAIPGKIAAAPLSQCSVSLGIAVEKMRLLREQSTEIHGGLTDDERFERLCELAERARSRALGLPDPRRAQGVG